MYLKLFTSLETPMLFIYINFPFFTFKLFAYLALINMIIIDVTQKVGVILSILPISDACLCG